ncbi:MAG: hypothetical protein K2L95_00295 [Alphaproteobacteria bacterium]|nr:hypothetical protein [Alphaproteobacteria bacterium]
MKKTTKTSAKASAVASAKSAPRVACCSTRQKVWGIIALAGLFTCGLMIGLAINRPTVNAAPNYAGDAVAAPAAPNADLKPTCTVIEELIFSRIVSENDDRPWVHLTNADNYAILAERGCPENAEHYKNMALREIEIASALQSDHDMADETQTEFVIDTYKKLNMQREAREFLDKVQKLTNPAIDFILQMEQIINE